MKAVYFLGTVFLLQCCVQKRTDLALSPSSKPGDVRVGDTIRLALCEPFLWGHHTHADSVEKYRVDSVRMRDGKVLLSFGDWRMVADTQSWLTAVAQDVRAIKPDSISRNCRYLMDTSAKLQTLLLERRDGERSYRFSVK